jgi:periplasmic protein TonB
VTTSPQRGGAATLELGEGRAPVRERLIAMLFLMALLHAIVILGLTFTSGSHGAEDQVPQVDVVLVTNEVAAAQKNEHAAYLSQRTQLGAGNTDLPLPVGSPESRGAIAANANGAAGEDEQGRADTDDAHMLATRGASPDIRYFGAESAPSADDSLPQFIGDTEGAPRSGRGDAPELMLKGPASAGRWVTPDTQASDLAPYLAAWKRKVEQVGTLNFPSLTSGLSGSPVVEVEIAANGHLEAARVRRSSGHEAIDKAALTVLRLASPFDPFPPELAAGYTRLHFAYQYEFTAGTTATAPVTPSADASSSP